MPTTTTTYSFNKPVVGADEDDWGGYLNGNWDSVDDLLDGTTPVTGIDINSGTIDNVVIGGTTAAAITGTTGQFNTSLNVDGTVTADGLTVDGGLTLNADLDVAEVKFQSTANAKVKVVSSTTGNSILMLGDTDDNDIGMIDYDNADNSMRFVTNTSEAMRIDSSGNVGIGTSSMGYPAFADNLTIADNANSGITIRSGSTSEGSIYFSHATGSSLSTYAGYINYNHSSDIMRFATDSVVRAVIDSSGNVGIGATSPDVFSRGYTRTVGISSSGSTSLAIQSAGDPQYPAIEMGRGSSRQFLITNQAAYTTIGTLENTSLRFVTNSSESLRITSAGLVGIGTSSPTHLLTVDGALNSDHVVITGQAGRGLVIGTAVTTNNDDTVVLNAQTSTGVLAFETNSTEAMRIDSSGNVGIGTSSPSATLDVSTGGSTKAAIFNGNGVDVKHPTLPSHLTLGTQTGSDVKIASVGAYPMLFHTNGSERMRIDSSGNLLVSKTSKDFGVTVGIELGEDGALRPTRDSSAPLIANRRTNHGDVILIVQENTTRGTLGTTSGGRLYIQSDGGANLAGIEFSVSGTSMTPRKNGASSDNEVDVGSATFRWDDVYATNGTIQTSDQNEKQQIASLTDAEITAAKAISKLFKTFKWNDSVAEKGDAARTHSGVIAQEVEQAMTDAGLNAGDYAFFISSTWWETQTEVPAIEAVEAQDAVYEDVIIPAVEEVLDEEGNVVTEAQPERTEQRLVSEAIEAVEGKEAYTRTDKYDTAEEAPEGATERNRKGIRYPELLSFIGAATEQRLASIESRLDALEA